MSNWYIEINVSTNKAGSKKIGVKDENIWNLVQVDKYICLTFRNEINLGNTMLYNLLDYGNELTEIILREEEIACNILSDWFFYWRIDSINTIFWFIWRR